MNTVIIKFIVGIALVAVGYFLLNKKLDIYFNGQKQIAKFEEVKTYKGGNKRRNAKKPDGHYVYYSYLHNNSQYQGNLKINKDELKKYQNYKKGDELEIFVSSKNPQNSSDKKAIHPVIFIVCGAFVLVGVFLIRK